jgi:hypothetical protein
VPRLLRHVGQHDDIVLIADLGMAYDPAGTGQAEALFKAECLAEEVDRGRRVCVHQVGDDALVSCRGILDHHDSYRGWPAAAHDLRPGVNLRLPPIWRQDKFCAVIQPPSPQQGRSDV